jgi:hypothetical protein
MNKQISMSNEDYELLSVDEMRKKYGLTAEDRPRIRLNARNVPENLQHLIPLAEFWGVGDDLIREDMVRKAPNQAIRELKRIIDLHENQLDHWLAGPEANDPNPSAEYLAFSAMRMASDFA